MSLSWLESSYPDILFTASHIIQIFTEFHEKSGYPHHVSCTQWRIQRGLSGGWGWGWGGGRNYLIFMGKFRKSWVNWSNRPPLSKFEPRIQQSLTVYPTILDRLDSLVVECPLRVREVAGSIPSLSYQRREKWYQYLPCFALSIKKRGGGTRFCVAMDTIGNEASRVINLSCRTCLTTDLK